MSLNLTTIALAWLAGSIILLPLMIIAIRFAVVPLVETITRPLPEPAADSAGERIARLEDRVARLAARVDRVDGGSAARSE